MTIESFNFTKKSGNDQGSKSRDVSLDLLRVIACFMIILIHVSPNYTIGGSENLASLVIQSIVRAELPIFFILSGYYILNKKIGALKKFYINKMSAIIIPFIIYGYIHFLNANMEWGIHASIYNIININTFYHFLQNIMQGPWGSVNGFGSQHFWFVYWIMGLYLLAPAIKILLDNINERRTAYAIIIILIVHFYWMYAIDFSFIKHYLYPIQLLPKLDIWLIYFILGGLIYRIDTLKLKPTSVIVAIISYITIIYLTKHNPSSSNQFNDGISMIALSFSIFILFREVRIKKYQKLIEYLSSKTYGIYLCHIFIYYFFNLKVKALINGGFSVPIITAIIVFVTSLIITIILDFLIVDRLVNKIKLN